MKPTFLLLVAVTFMWAGPNLAVAATNLAAPERILLIDSSSMKLGPSKATLVIGPLQRADGVYTGDYKVKVFPYFFKNEKGRLAITVSDETLARAAAGKVVSITGTATTSEKQGKPRPVTATATPVDRNGGGLKLWFLAGDQQMTFEPAYHFAEKPVVVAAAPPKTKP